MYHFKEREIEAYILEVPATYLTSNLNVFSVMRALILGLVTLFGGPVVFIIFSSIYSCFELPIFSVFSWKKYGSYPFQTSTFSSTNECFLDRHET